MPKLNQVFNLFSSGRNLEDCIKTFKSENYNTKFVDAQGRSVDDQEIRTIVTEKVGKIYFGFFRTEAEQCLEFFLRADIKVLTHDFKLPKSQDIDMTPYLYHAPALAETQDLMPFMTTTTTTLEEEQNNSNNNNNNNANHTINVQHVELNVNVILPGDIIDLTTQHN